MQDGKERSLEEPNTSSDEVSQTVQYVQHLHVTVFSKLLAETKCQDLDKIK